MKHLISFIALAGIAAFSSCSSTPEMEKAQESAQESEESLYYEENDPYELGTDRFIWDENETIF